MQWARVSRAEKINAALHERSKKDMAEKDQLAVRCNGPAFKNQCGTGLANEAKDACELRVEVYCLKEERARRVGPCRVVRGKTD